MIAAHHGMLEYLKIMEDFKGISDTIATMKTTVCVNCESSLMIIVAPVLIYYCRVVGTLFIVLLPVVVWKHLSGC